MQYENVQGICRHQMQFTSPDDFIFADNPVRFIDIFIEMLLLSPLVSAGLGEKLLAAAFNRGRTGLGKSDGGGTRT